MEINVEWLDTQEPGPFVVAVQEAWDRVPSHWTRLLPQKTILFLASPGAEADVYKSKEASEQDGRILIVLPKDCEYEQVFKISLLALAETFIQMNRVENLLKSALHDLVKFFDFTEEEKALVYNPEFTRQLFLSYFMAYTLGFFNQESAHEFAWAFIAHVNTIVENLEV